MRTHATEEVLQPFGAANNRCVLLKNRKRTKTKVFTEIENIQVKDASIENVDAFITHVFHILSYVTMEDEQILVKLKQKLQKGAQKDHTRLQACISTHEQGKDKKSPYQLRDAVQDLCATLRAEAEGNTRGLRIPAL